MSALPKLAQQHRLHIIDALKFDPRYPTHRKKVERMLADVRGARRFILGDEASYQVGAWIKGCEDLLLDHRQFAKSPFPKTYIELSIAKLHNGLGRPLTAGPANTEDDRLGFLIVGNHVRATGLTLGKKIFMGAWEYWLDTPEDTRLMSCPPDREDWLRLCLMLGSTVHALKDEDQRRAILASTRIRCNYAADMDTRLKDENTGRLTTMGAQMIAYYAGELRTLLAVLLLINQHRGHLSMQLIPRMSAITPKGRRVYAEHTLVSLPLHAPHEARRFYYPDKRASPVGHEVRGHWVRHQLHPGCEHVWPHYPDDDGHFVCARCQGFRVWRKPHHRGHTEVGFNLTQYEVTP